SSASCIPDAAAPVACTPTPQLAPSHRRAPGWWSQLGGASPHGYRRTADPRAAINHSSVVGSTPPTHAQYAIACVGFAHVTGSDAASGDDRSKVFPPMGTRLVVWHAVVPSAGSVQAPAATHAAYSATVTGDLLMRNDPTDARARGCVMVKP